MIVKCVNSVDPDDSSLTWHSTCSSPIPTSKKSPSGNGLPEVRTCCPSKVVPKLYWDNSQLSQVTLSRSYEKHYNPPEKITLCRPGGGVPSSAYILQGEALRPTALYMATAKWFLWACCPFLLPNKPFSFIASALAIVRLRCIARQRPTA